VGDELRGGVNRVDVVLYGGGRKEYKQGEEKPCGVRLKCEKGLFLPMESRIEPRKLTTRSYTN